MGLSAFRAALLRAAAGAALALALASTPAFAANCHGLKDKYFFDVHNKTLAKSLKSRLGKAFRRFDDRYQTQIPFASAGDGYVFAPACMAHSCTVEEAFLGIDEETCAVFVSLLEDGKHTDSFPASGWPPALESARQDWINGKF